MKRFFKKKKTERKSYSLRGTLITSIVLSTLILWGMSLAITTYISWNQTKRVLDEALVRSAQVLFQLVEKAPPPMREHRVFGGRVDLDDDHFYFQVISKGRVIAKSSRAPNEPFIEGPKPHKGFTNLLFEGEPWRVFVLQKKHSAYEIQVGHAVKMRHEFLEDLTEELISSGLTGLVLSLLLNALIVFLGLKPLTAISQQLSRLSPKNLTPIAVKTRGKEIIAIEDSLNMLLINLEVARQHERQFTADASHELRTPLSAIQMKLQLLQREKPELASALAPLQHDISRATHLIEHLLLLARLDPMAMHSSEKLPLQPVAIDTLLKEVVDLFQSEITRKSLKIDCSVPAYRVLANRDLLLIAVKNILGNACKYAPAGSTITLSAKEQSPYIVIVIRDNGKGVSPEELERLTQRFYRVLGTKETGSGLGLSIVKKIVELHQGDMRLRSIPEIDGLEVSLFFKKI